MPVLHVPFEAVLACGPVYGQLVIAARNLTIPPLLGPWSSVNRIDMSLKTRP